MNDGRNISAHAHLLISLQPPSMSAQVFEELSILRNMLDCFLSGILTSTFLKVSMISLSNSASANFLFCVTLFGKGSGMLSSACLLLLCLDYAPPLTGSASSNFSVESAFAVEPNSPAESDFSNWFRACNSLPLLKVMALTFLGLVMVWEGRLLEP